MAEHHTFLYYLNPNYNQQPTSQATTTTPTTVQKQAPSSPPTSQQPHLVSSPHYQIPGTICHGCGAIAGNAPHSTICPVMRRHLAAPAREAEPAKETVVESIERKRKYDSSSEESEETEGEEAYRPLWEEAARKRLCMERAKNEESESESESESDEESEESGDENEDKDEEMPDSGVSDLSRESSLSGR
jgi:hypothetical protein